jgi:ParB family chromosome partitioning protein
MPRTMSMIEIPLSRLVHSHSNVRKTGRSIGLEGLAASIAAHGLRQNLTVKLTTAGRYEVVAGGRRLAALKQLVKHGQLSREATVPCLVVAPEEEAKELSLVENAVRVDMHPDDQAQAFAELVRAGSLIDDIAVRFGTTSRTSGCRTGTGSPKPSAGRLPERDWVPIRLKFWPIGRRPTKLPCPAWGVDTL